MSLRWSRQTPRDLAMPQVVMGFGSGEFEAENVRSRRHGFDRLVFVSPGLPGHLCFVHSQTAVTNGGRQRCTGRNSRPMPRWTNPGGNEPILVFPTFCHPCCVAAESNFGLPRCVNQLNQISPKRAGTLGGAIAPNTCCVIAGHQPYTTPHGSLRFILKRENFEIWGMRLVF